MIPRIIHYCWFGGNPLPKSAQRCIASWRKFMPDCEIREWNEQNFDVNAHPYTRAAYAAGSMLRQRLLRATKYSKNGVAFISTRTLRLWHL